MRNKIIEYSTYIFVILVIWFILPLFGIFLDSLIFASGSSLPGSDFLIVPGAFLIIAGAILDFWTIALFKAEGRGTPNPILPPVYFVSSGPYRFSRNPMVIGVFLIILGQSFFFFSLSLLAVALLFGAVLYLYIICYEEPSLRERFGEPYVSYCMKVPRFLPVTYKDHKKEMNRLQTRRSDSVF